MTAMPTLSDILQSVHDFLGERRRLPRKIRVSPALWTKLLDTAKAGEIFPTMDGAHTLRGIEIVVDPKLPDDRIAKEYDLQGEAGR